METAHHGHSSLVGEKGHQEEPLVPESDDHSLILGPELIGVLGEKNPFGNGQGEEAKDEKIDSRNDNEEDFIFPVPPVRVCTHSTKPKLEVVYYRPLVIGRFISRFS